MQVYKYLSPYLKGFPFGDDPCAPGRNGAYFIVAADPLSLVLAKPPSAIGADVVVGSMQRFGVPMWPRSGTGGDAGGQRVAMGKKTRQNAMRMP